ncbi:hypothetical protein DFP72DRAFT_755549, partial [Ephemerocybe angulata]
MPWRYVPSEMKRSALRLYESGLLELEDILDYLEMSRSTFFRVRRIWREHGDVVAPRYGLAGRRRAFHFEDIDYLLRLVRHRPNWFLDELQHLLQTNRFISLHFSTIHRELSRLGVSRKKLRKIAAERDE